MGKGLKRFLRVFVSGGIAYLLKEWQGQDWWLVGAPIISAVGKWIRTKYDVDWLPF